MSHHLKTRAYTDVNRKVAYAGTVGTGISAVLLWLVPNVLGIPVPPEIAATIGSLVAAGVGYIVKELQG